MSNRRVLPVDEVVCRLEADGRELRVFHCTPERYVDLAAGWLIGAGLLEASNAPASRFSLVRRETGPVVYVDAIAGAWSDHDIPRPDERVGAVAPERVAPPADFADLFRELYARAARYHDTGGIHACAVARDEDLVSHAEDVGRHNAVDKAIGEAALAGVDLTACGLVTSARVSGEMARKAAHAGLGWIASRSVPTTLALTIGARAGVTIVARAASPERRVFEPIELPLGVVMAGGRNTRFGAPKALEEVAGRRIVDRVIEALRATCSDVVMIANDAHMYAAVELEKRPDTHTGAGPLGGLLEALAWARERGMPGILVVACDMPFVPASLLAALWRAARVHDAVLPESDGPRGVEPLCAAYRVTCLDAVERALERGDRRMVGFHDDVRVRRMAEDEIAQHGDPASMFFNVNTREELDAARAIAEDAEVAP